MKAMIVIMVLVLTSCGTSKTKLTDSGKNVEILANKPGNQCHMLGKVVGENDQGSTELARNHARNLAAKLDANSLWVDQEVPNGNQVKVHASAYQCE